MIEIPKPDDFHVHLRQGEALKQYSADLAAEFGRALVMPNTLPPIKTANQLASYRSQIHTAAAEAGHPGFEALMSFKLGEDLSPEEIDSLAAAGALAGKLYPRGATTHSEDGVGEIEELYPLFEAMQASGLVLCIHGEDPSAFSLDRESSFLPRVKDIVRNFPGLRVVMEHISTEEAVEALKRFPDRVAATVTMHHLLCNLDDMIGGFLNPHLFCKPVLKAPGHQAALQRAVLSGHERLFFGSDSAPHPRNQKEAACGCAGVYTAPVALPMLAAWFRDQGRLDLFESFLCQKGAAFYGLPMKTSGPRIRILEQSWTVPERYGDVVPFAAGQELGLKVEEIGA